MSDSRAPLDRSAAAIGLLTVVAANCLYLSGLPLILDPMMSMDPYYIHQAQQPLAGIVAQDPAWGPLYAVWLKPFRLILGDPLAVYRANLYGLSLGTSLLLYLYLLLLTRRAAVAVAAALFFLIGDFNVPLASKVSGFALMVVLAGLAASELVPGGARRTTVAAVGVLLAAYARPELYPAAVCLCVAAVWLAGRELRSRGSSVLLWPLTGLVMLLLLAVSPGPPLFSASPGDDRLLSAFREHFAWNWIRWHGQTGYYLAIWTEAFRDARTTAEAFANNPGAVARHLADNLFGTLGFLSESGFGHYPLLAPANQPSLVRVETLLAAAAVIGSLCGVAVRPIWRRALLARYRHALLTYVIVGVSSLSAAVVIYPVPHYLALPAVLLLLAGALAATVMFPVAVDFSWRGRVLTAFVCLAAVPRPFVLPSAYVVPGSPFTAHIGVRRTITDTIEFVRGLGLPAPVRVLTLTDGIGELLGPRFQEVKVWQKGSQPLADYMRDNDVGIIVSLEPGRTSFVIDDPLWPTILQTPEAVGFTRVPVPHHAAVGLYVRTDLLAERPAGQ